MLSAPEVDLIAAARTKLLASPELSAAFGGRVLATWLAAKDQKFPAITLTHGEARWDAMHGYDARKVSLYADIWARNAQGLPAANVFVRQWAEAVRGLLHEQPLDMPSWRLQALMARRSVPLPSPAENIDRVRVSFDAMLYRKDAS